MKLGSQVYINREDSPAQVRERMKLLAEHGMVLCRLFLDWDQVEPRRGRWTFEQYDASFDAGAEFGVGCVPTLMSVAPPGWMNRTNASQAKGGWFETGLRAQADDYLCRCVDHYRGHPALHSWIAWNEPSVGHIDWDEPGAREAFAAFLEAQYGELERFNRLSFRQIEAFEQALPQTHSLGAIKNRQDRLDEVRFRRWVLLERVREDIALIRQHDPDHPVHLNPAGIADLDVDTAQDIFAEGELCDFMGASAHPVWHAPRLPRERWPQAIGHFCCLARDASRPSNDREGYFWLTEMQAGPAAFSGFGFGGPDATDLRLWMAEALGRGAAANVFWCLNVRTRGGEAGEWALLDQRGLPSPRLKEVKRFAERLAPHRGLLERVGSAKPTVRLLHSIDSIFSGHAYSSGGDTPENPRKSTRCNDALTGAFLLFDDLGIDAGFVGEASFAREPMAALDGASVLVLPDAWALHAQTFEAVRIAAETGVTVIADGLTGYLDPDTHLHTDHWAVLAEVFGGGLADYLPTPGQFDLPLDPPVPGYFNRISFVQTAGETLASWPHDQHAAVICRRHAAGNQCVRVGTHLFQRYFHHAEPSARDWIAGLLPDAAFPAIPCPSCLRMLRLAEPGASEPVALVVMNPTDTPVEVALPEHARRLDGLGQVIAPQDFGLFGLSRPVP